MLRVSIFTPSHNPKYLFSLYQSIKDQGFYEWVILLNNTSWDIPTEIREDFRVRIHRTPSTGDSYVGTLKRLCCEECKGDILLEVDHDDLLIDGAIQEVSKAFENNPDVGFVYSNTVNFRDQFQKSERFAEGHGWEYKPFKYKSYQLEEFKAFPPTPESVSRIWYAPNHLRAWRKDVYNQVGGHADMRVLDDLELMCRTYLVTKFHHIDRALYLYRIDSGNTWLKYNEEIQNNVYRIYDEYIERMILRLYGRKIDLGARFNHDPIYESVDLKNADINCDLNQKWPFEDNSVAVIRATDIFEHLQDPINAMKECYRVLKPGGWIIGQVPSTDGRGAFQDPTHKSFWNENSFLYYTDQNWSRWIDTPVRFQAIRLFTTEKDSNQVCWVKFHLLKLANNRPPGLINI